MKPKDANANIACYGDAKLGKKGQIMAFLHYFFARKVVKDSFVATE